jgi:antibiotic biosynthesis monooxygenase (ABM) superfamily enzyme
MKERMDPSSPNTPGPHVQVRGARASSVIVHRVPPDRAEQFLELQRGITEAAKAFPGYQATDVYPPAERQQSEWVVVIHFDGPETLQRWLDSPARAGWIEKLRNEMGDFRLRTLPTGFGAWFASLVNGSEGALPPPWKIALSVLLALYPTVMVLAICLGPYLNPLGLAVSMLISNALSVSILQWAVTPALNPLLRHWLRANEQKQRAVSLGGLVAILLLLGGMAMLFRLVTG